MARQSYGIAYAHADGYRASPLCKLVAAADIAAENLNALCDRYGLEARYDSAERMLAEANLDLVSICTWPGLHVPLVELAARSGVRGILCEKPMALGLRAARGLVQLCNSRGLKLAINTQRRLNPRFRWVRDQIAGGRLGSVRYLHAAWAGGDMLSFSIHWLDMHRFWLGDPEPEWLGSCLEFQEGNRFQGYFTEVGAIARYRMKDVLCQLDTGTLGQGSPGFLAVGDAGTLDTGPQGRFRLRTASGEEGAPEEGPFNDFEAAVTDLASAVLENRTPQLSAENGLHTVEMIEAAYRSAADRRRVEWPIGGDRDLLGNYTATGKMP
ncbi:MAG: Gfo/Idh/MocA family oxidoreductase [Planctomycetes bacterium]|nr:Gfo/Idh/MocA family oxidoreductase [Planctomycetota bacterium]